MKNEIETNIKDLKEKFLIIKNMKYVKGMRKGTGGMGYTFESLINKKEDSSYLPDYKGIEIKTKFGNTKEPLALFSMAPRRDDGIIYSKYILCNYGYQQVDNKMFKKFICTIYYKCFDKIYNNYRFKTKVDLNSNKLKLVIMNNDYEIIDDNTYWDLTELKERLITKLSYLALIKGYSCQINKNTYYKFTNISFYKLKEFNSFIELLKKSKIYISFNIYTINNQDISYEKIYDKGATFRLKMDNIEDLFTKFLI